MKKLSQDLINWIETTIEKICQENGYGHVCVTWHIKDGKLDGMEKRAVETEKFQLIKSTDDEDEPATM